MALLPTQMEERGEPAGMQRNEGNERPDNSKYRKLVEMLLNFIYSEEGVRITKETFARISAPGEAIGMVTANVIAKVISDSKQAGKEVPPVVVIRASLEVLGAVMELAQEAGLLEGKDPNEVSKKAFNAAMEIASQNIGDMIRQEEAQMYGEMRNSINGGQ